MQEIDIHTFEARYHLPPSQLSRRQQLDAVLRQVLDEGLPLALEKCGISTRREICIRRIVMPVRLSISSPESALVAAWSEALAQYIHQAVVSGQSSGRSSGRSSDRSRQVLCYDSPAEALVDFVLHLDRGDFSKTWAWRQMGFVPDKTPDTVADGAAALVATLRARPRRIVPLVTTMARRDNIAALARLLNTGHWTILAAAALAVHGVPAAERLVAEAVKVADAGIPEPRIQRMANRIMTASALAKAIRRDDALIRTVGIPAAIAAIFAVLEAEPDLLLRANVSPRSLLRTLVASFSPVCPPPAVPAASDTVRDRTSSSAHNYPNQKHPEEHRVNGIQEATPPAEAVQGRPATQPAVSDNAVPGDIGPSPGPPASRRTGSGTADSSESVPPPVSYEDNRPPAADPGPIPWTAPMPSPDDSRTDTGRRSVGVTDAGGLLFLLPLLAPLGIIDAVGASPCFQDRSLRWVLHRLALALLPMDQITSRDPGVLAFCGLRPDDPPPEPEAPGPSASEKTMLVKWKEQLAAILRERLGWPDMSDPKLLHTVCTRRTRIEADPGWFTVFFSMSDVRTDIRKAALDLDPGFLPWLGVVMTYVYE